MQKSNSARESVCPHCGKRVEGLLSDIGYTLPDDVWALPRPIRERRAACTQDWCTLDDGRFFVRCILYVPFSDREGEFGWGLWASVSDDDFRRYIDLYNQDGSAEPLFPGKIANEPPCYPGLCGQPVKIQLGAASERPRLMLAKSNRHLLAREQRTGIDLARQHELVESCGAV